MKSKKTFTIFLATIAFFPNSPRLRATLDTAKFVVGTAAITATTQACSKSCSDPATEAKVPSINPNENNTLLIQSCKEQKEEIASLKKLLKEKDEKLRNSAIVRENLQRMIVSYKAKIIHLNNQLSLEKKKTTELNEKLKKPQKTFFGLW